MGKKFSALLSTALVAALCGTASAYTLNGTVTGKDGKAIQGANVKLIKRNKSTTTDEQGKFTIEETSTHLNATRSAGNFSMNNGVLNFSQNGSNPVQVKIFDMVGNQVFAQTFQGSGSVDLNSVIEAQGTYLARIKLGSAQLSGMSLAAVTGMLLGLVMYLLDKFHLTNEYADAEDEEDIAETESKAADL